MKTMRPHLMNSGRTVLALLTALCALVASGCEQKPAPDTATEKAPQQGAAATEGGEAATAEAAADETAPAAADETAPAAADETAPAAADETAPAAADETAPAAAPAADGIDWAAVLRDPSLATATAPETFKVALDTTKGPVVIEVYRDWAPLGADRLYNLVKAGYFEDIALFRVLPGFMAQFGMHGDPALNAIWSDANIKDDPVKESNVRGTVTFAMAGPDTRSTQFFINTADNKRLDDMGFSPLGKVLEGMDVVDSFYAEYGEGAPRGAGPDQGEIHARGNAYLKAQFPKLDYVKSARIVE